MKVAISQPRYYPWIGYLEKIAMADMFIILDLVQFSRRAYENRVQVRHGDGRQWLTVPVRAHQSTIIHEVQIDSAQDWITSHKGILRQQYAKAPYFREYWDDVTLSMRNFTRLLDLNMMCLIALCSAFDLKMNFRLQSAIQPQPRSKGSDLMLSLCKAVGATAYVSGIHGKDYLNTADFRAAGIEIIWQSPNYPAYTQLLGTEFIPGLSALDLLFNEGRDGLQKVLSSC